MVPRATGDAAARQAGRSYSEGRGPGARLDVDVAFGDSLLVHCAVEPLRPLLHVERLHPPQCVSGGHRETTARSTGSQGSTAPQPRTHTYVPHMLARTQTSDHPCRAPGKRGRAMAPASTQWNS